MAETELQVHAPLFTNPSLCRPGGTLTVICSGADTKAIRISLISDRNTVLLDINDSMPNDHQSTFTCSLPETMEPDLYDLSLSAQGDTVTIPNAVSVKECFKQDFTFIHISDLHLVKADRTGTVIDRRSGINDLIDTINDLDAEFIINTGDIVSRYGKEPFDILPSDHVKQQFTDALDMLSKLNKPMFTIPGNHDLAFDHHRYYWKKTFSTPPENDFDIRFSWNSCRFIGLDGSVAIDPETNTPAIKGYTQKRVAALIKELSQTDQGTRPFLFFHYDDLMQLGPVIQQGLPELIMYGHSVPLEYPESTTLVSHLMSWNYALISVDKMNKTHIKTLKWIEWDQ